MPMLMEKKDWTQAVSSFATQDRVWQEDVSGDTNVVPLSLPELGQYRVYLVKIGNKQPLKSPERKSARDLLGYGARFHKLRTTEEWMQELREGEEP